MKIFSLDKRKLKIQFIKCTNTNTYLVIVGDKQHLFSRCTCDYVAQYKASTLCKNLYGVGVNRFDVKFEKKAYL